MYVNRATPHYPLINGWTRTIGVGGAHLILNFSCHGKLNTETGCKKVGTSSRFFRCERILWILGQQATSEGLGMDFVVKQCLQHNNHLHYNSLTTFKQPPKLGCWLLVLWHRRRWTITWDLVHLFLLLLTCNSAPNCKWPWLCEVLVYINHKRLTEVVCEGQGCSYSPS